MHKAAERSDTEVVLALTDAPHLTAEVVREYLSDNPESPIKDHPFVVDLLAAYPTGAQADAPPRGTG